MSHNRTEHTTEPTIADQADALDAIVALAETHPTLPAPFIGMHAPVFLPATLKLQLRTPDAFEAWRDALGVDPGTIKLHAPDMGTAWLSADIQFLGVEVELTGHGIELPRVSLVKAVAA